MRRRTRGEGRCDCPACSCRQISFVDTSCGSGRPLSGSCGLWWWGGSQLLCLGLRVACTTAWEEQQGIHLLCQLLRTHFFVSPEFNVLRLLWRSGPHRDGCPAAGKLLHPSVIDHSVRRLPSLYSQASVWEGELPSHFPKL